jgi:hypothetical protein
MSDAYSAKATTIEDARTLVRAALTLANAPAFGRPGAVSITAYGTWAERARSGKRGDLVFAGESAVERDSIWRGRFVRLRVGSEWVEAEPWDGGLSGGQDAYLRITVSNDF